MRFLIIGLGSMGKRRIRLLKVIRPQDEIIGVDQDEKRLTEAKEKYEVRGYASIEAAVRQHKIDCAFVCTSPISHGHIIHQCLENNMNVFTEINLVSDLYKENIKLAEQKEKLLFLSSTPIYRDEIKKIKQEVHANGKPVNYIYHVGQYLPDWHPWEKYTDFFVQNPRTNGCREIFAIEMPWMQQVFGKIISIHVLASKLTNLKLNYMDSFLVQFEHENGTKGIFAVDVTCRQAVKKLEVYNENLFLEWNGKPETLQKKNLNTGDMVKICDSQYKNEAGYSELINEYAYVNELNAFFNELELYPECNLKDIYGFEQDFATLRLIDQIEGK